jgi:hypothetical protein
VIACERAAFAKLADGDGVLVDTETAFYFGLNRTATCLWEQLTLPEGATLHELTTALVRRFEVSASDAESDAGAFVDTVLSQGLARTMNEVVPTGDSSSAGRST